MENRVCAKHKRIFCFNVCACVCVNVSWRFCKWSGIAFTHAYVRKCVRRTCGRHFRTSQHSEIRRNLSGFFNEIHTCVYMQVHTHIVCKYTCIYIHMGEASRRILKDSFVLRIPSNPPRFFGLLRIHPILHFFGRAHVGGGARR